VGLPVLLCRLHKVVTWRTLALEQLSTTALLDGFICWQIVEFGSTKVSNISS
jgi:hypothetical protein